MSDATPNGTRMYARSPDGTEIEITEGVQALYDLVLSSMDWSSGFWTADDARPVSVIAHACGFANVADVDDYIAVSVHGDEMHAWLNTTDPKRQRTYTSRNGYQVVEHEHVLSSVGRCMWPGCKEGKA